jgi:hypothetical protein
MKGGHFAASWGTGSFSRRTVLHEVGWIDVLDLSPFSNKEFFQGTAVREADNK